MIKTCKIVSWNVNGIRSFIEKNGAQILAGFDSDIICLQETKLSSPEFTIDLPGYHQYYSCATRSGYAGTAILTREEPISVSSELSGIDTEGRILTAEFGGFYLICVYAPSIGSGRDLYRTTWDDELLTYLFQLKNVKPIVLCGDFNVAHLDIDVYSPSDFQGTPGFTYDERVRFGRLLSAGFTDAYRLFHPGSVAFTWWSYRGHERERNAGMRLDYFVVSQALSTRLVSCDICSEIHGSDHCPIELYVAMEPISDEEVEDSGSVIPFPINVNSYATGIEGMVNSSFGNNTSNLTAQEIAVQDTSSALLDHHALASGLRFRRYDHAFTDESGCRITRSFIILHRDDGMFWFTDFHKYIRNPNTSVHNLSQHGVSRFDFIVPLLNYVFFDCGIKSLDEITVEVIQKYLNLYAQTETQNGTPQKDTVTRKIRYCFDFLYLALQDKTNRFSFSLDDLYRNVTKRDKRGRVYTEKVPVFEVSHVSTPKIPMNRDIPEKAFFALLDLIVRRHTDLLGLVIAGSFVGCRPGEATNLRCENSPLGPGFRFTEINGSVVRIEVDLSVEMTLRSDNVHVGDIKKERTQFVPSIFIQPFMTCYRIYEEFMSHRYRDPNYMPFSVNRSGQAITYDTYRKRFRKIVEEEFIPILMESDDPELVIYGKILTERPISPHIFRHFYTVQLVLSGVKDVGELMSMRGDSSPESALSYLKDKGELEKQYRLVNDHTFDYLQSAAANWMKERSVL